MVGGRRDRRRGRPRDRTDRTTGYTTGLLRVKRGVSPPLERRTGRSFAPRTARTRRARASAGVPRAFPRPARDGLHTPDLDDRRADLGTGSRGGRPRPPRGPLGGSAGRTPHAPSRPGARQGFAAPKGV